MRKNMKPVVLTTCGIVLLLLLFTFCVTVLHFTDLHSAFALLNLLTWQRHLFACTDRNFISLHANQEEPRSASDLMDTSSLVFKMSPPMSGSSRRYTEQISTVRRPSVGNTISTTADWVNKAGRAR